MKLEKLFWVLSLMSLAFFSCKDDEENDSAKEPETITKYYTIGSGASTAGCYLSLRDDKVYRISTEEEVWTADDEYLKHVDLIFDGKDFYSPTSSCNPTINSNGIKTHVNPYGTGYFFETSEGYYGQIYFEGNPTLGDPKVNYRIRVEYQKRDTPSENIEETLGGGYVVPTDTFYVVIGSKTSPLTPYFSVKLMDTINVNDKERMAYADFCQKMDGNESDLNLGVVSSDLSETALFNHIYKKLNYSGVYTYSTGGIAGEYPQYEGTITQKFSYNTGDPSLGKHWVNWTLEITRKGIRVQ